MAVDTPGPTVVVLACDSCTPTVVKMAYEEATMSATEIDEAKLEAFMGQAVTDMGAIISAPLMIIGGSSACTRRWRMPGR